MGRPASANASGAIPAALAKEFPASFGRRSAAQPAVYDGITRDCREPVSDRHLPESLTLQVLIAFTLGSDCCKQGPHIGDGEFQRRSGFTDPPRFGRRLFRRTQGHSRILMNRKQLSFPYDDSGAIMSESQLINARQAAEILSISERKLWGMSHPRGPIPVVRIGRAVRYRRSSLDLFLERNEQSK